jgi:hypothetical protein
MHLAKRPALCNTLSKKKASHRWNVFYFRCRRVEDVDTKACTGFTQGREGGKLVWEQADATGRRGRDEQTSCGDDIAVSIVRVDGS